MRHLHTRVPEHLGLTPITGQPSSSPVMSSIFSHLNTTGHSADFDDFEILSSCSDNCELLIHESRLISKLKPSLLTSRATLFRLTFCNLPLSSVLFPELYRPVIHTPSYLLLSLRLISSYAFFTYVYARKTSNPSIF